MFLNCYGDWTPLKGTTVDVGDIVTPMMHDDVMFHLWCSKQSNLIILDIVSWTAGELYVSKVESFVSPSGVGRIFSKILSSFTGFTAEQWKNWANNG